MDKSKKLLRLRTRVVESSSYTIKIPFPDALKKLLEFFNSPHRPATCTTVIFNSTDLQYVMHSHVIYHELLIVDKWTARAAGIAHTLLLDLCEQERSRQFGHFDCSIPNFNHFAPCFALSMQCIFWTVLLIILSTNYWWSVWFHTITTSHYIIWQLSGATLLIMQ